jgi:hypothetical protein
MPGLTREETTGAKAAPLRTWRRGRWTLLSFVASLSVLACGKPLEAEDCERLLDHYTELLVREETPEATPVFVAQRMDEARALLRKDPRFELPACGRKVSRASYACAMSAPTVDAVEHCMMF